jgi:hypothetical protein
LLSMSLCVHTSVCVAPSNHRPGIAKLFNKCCVLPCQWIGWSIIHLLLRDSCRKSCHQSCGCYWGIHCCARMTTPESAIKCCFSCFIFFNPSYPLSNRSHIRSSFTIHFE